MTPVPMLNLRTTTFVLALLCLLGSIKAIRSQGSAILSGIKALRIGSANQTIVRRQQSTQLCANNYCTSLDAPGLGTLQKCKPDDQPCICQASQQLSSSCLSCHSNLSSITDIFNFYQECRLIPKPPTPDTCRPLCSADFSAVNALSTCGSEDNTCICNGVDQISSLPCLNCIMYLGGREYTGSDVKQTCLVSSNTLATALRPSSTITPRSTGSSSPTASYSSEAVTSAISIAQPTSNVTGSAVTEPTGSSGNGVCRSKITRGIVVSLGVGIVTVALVLI